MNDDIAKIKDSLRMILETEKLSGMDDICIPVRKVEKETVKVDRLDVVCKSIKECVKCPLAKTRINVVPGEGVSNARLMFVGEAPGADEDKQGRPFVGRAGQLLTKIIESIGLKREEVFIANILKCRPPANRNPLPEEISLCTPHLKEQIRIINPRVICALGKFSAQTLLETDVPISRLRGQFFEYEGIKLIPTYHPAYLLRNSAGKKDVWDDMKMIAKELGLKVPRKKEGA